MVEVFKRSWHITKLSFGVVRQDKEMLLFPVLAGIFSLLYSVLLLYPSIIVDMNTSDGIGPVEIVLLFVTYFGLSFIATFFNVCVVYTTKVRFEGGDATFGQSWGFAMSRLGQIAKWALVSASVGVALRLLDAAAQRAGAVGQAIMSVLVSLLGMAWTVITLFVVPIMVYENVGPKDALKRSTETLKRTWGESLMRHYGLGLIQFVCLMLAALIGVALFAILGGLGGFGLLVAFLLTLALVIGVILVFNVANAVFNTALYAYANGQGLPGGFDQNTVENAFRSKDR